MRPHPVFPEALEHRLAVTRPPSRHCQGSARTSQPPPFPAALLLEHTHSPEECTPVRLGAQARGQEQDLSALHIRPSGRLPSTAQLERCSVHHVSLGASQVVGSSSIFHLPHCHSAFCRITNT